MAVLKVLLVEDHKEWQNILRERTNRAWQDIDHASDSELRLQVVATFEEAWEALNKEGPWHLLVTDIGLGSSKAQQKLGMQLAGQASNLQVPTIVVSGTEVLTRLDVRDLLKEYGALDFFSKQDFDGDKFTTKVRHVLQALEPPGNKMLPPEFKQKFDVFLSHNSQDKPHVLQIGAALKNRGLSVWLDEWEQVPGRPWQEALEEIIRTTKSAAVLVGKDGIGPWEEPEMRACLDQFVKRRLPVIPVLLPGAPQKPDLPLFLQAFNWVDLRSGLSAEGLTRLHWGITGVNPDAHR